MADTVSEHVPMKDWSARQHIEQACELVDRFQTNRHPALLDEAKVHAIIGLTKSMVG